MPIVKKIFLLVTFSIFSVSSIISGELSEAEQFKAIDKAEEDTLDAYNKEVNKNVNDDQQPQVDSGEREKEKAGEPQK